jgi:hypothetical protein
MKGYPKGPLTKIDYENLCKMPEYAERAKTELAKLANIDDSKIEITEGTPEKPTTRLIANPLPNWKVAGFRSADDMKKFASDITQVKKVKK